MTQREQFEELKKRRWPDSLDDSFIIGSDGKYEFAATERCWELFQAAIAALIASMGDPMAFANVMHKDMIRVTLALQRTITTRSGSKVKTTTNRTQSLLSHSTPFSLSF